MTDKKTFLVYWQDVVSGGMDGGVFQRDHVVCTTIEARDREMARMIKEHIQEVAEGQDPDWTWEPYVSGRTGDVEGAHYKEVDVLDDETPKKDTQELIDLLLQEDQNAVVGAAFTDPAPAPKFKMRTYDDLIRWVEENTETDNVPDALVWFACFQLANCSYSRKDVAHLHYDGITPRKDNPEKHVNEYLDSVFDCQDEELAVEEILTELKEYFA